MKKNLKTHLKYLCYLIFISLNLIELSSNKFNAEALTVPIQQSRNQCTLNNVLINHQKTENDEIENYFQSLDYYLQGLYFYDEGNLSDTVDCIKIAIQLEPKFWLDELKDRGPIESRKAKKSYRQGLDELNARSNNIKLAKEYLKTALKNFKLLKDDYCSQEVAKILEAISPMKSSPTNSNSRLRKPSEKCLS